MLVLSKSKLKELKSELYQVYHKAPLTDGSECFSSAREFNRNESFCVSSVKAENIKSCEGKYYYTTEDLSSTSDWWPAHIIDINTTFKKCKKVKSHLGTVINDDKCLVDVSGLPAFNGVNEDLTINNYKFYLTLFKEYTVKQCQYERKGLHDAAFKSSKYDLIAKMQNSNFLKSKDFKVINIRRQEVENVKVGLIIKEDAHTEYGIDYGTVYLNMDNQVSIIWH